MAQPPLKANFIRSQPLDMPIKELQRAAKKAGLGEIGDGYISKTRGEMKRKPRAQPATTINGAAQTGPIDTAQPEQQLRAIVVTLGTARVRAIIDALEAQLMGGAS